MDKRYRGGRAIAAVVDKLGWLAAIGGLAVAGWSSLGAGGGDLALRVLAGVPGLTVTLLGLIAVTVAQLTRAAMDGAEALRELVRAGRTPHPVPDPAARDALRAAATRAVPSAARPVPRAAPEEMPAPEPARSAPRLRLSADARPAGAARSAGLAAPSSGPGRDGGRVHPIFSARPPR